MNTFGTMFAIVVASFLAGCPTSDDCSSDPSLCEGDDGSAEDGADADVESDVAALVELRVETWTLVDGVRQNLSGAEARLDHTTGAVLCSTPCDLQVRVGTHRLYLALPGWVQGPNPLEIRVDEGGVVADRIPATIAEVDGLTLRQRLDWDISANWRHEGTSGIVTMEVATLSPDTTPECPNAFSPDSCVWAGPFLPFTNVLYIEGNSLSICKAHSPDCGGLWASGRITSDGQRMEIDFVPSGGGPVEHHVYTRVP
jgi:hypothetical protein